MRSLVNNHGQRFVQDVAVVDQSPIMIESKKLSLNDCLSKCSAHYSAIVVFLRRVITHRACSNRQRSNEAKNRNRAMQNLYLSNFNNFHMKWASIVAQMILSRRLPFSCSLTHSLSPSASQLEIINSCLIAPISYYIFVAHFFLRSRTVCSFDNF